MKKRLLTIAAMMILCILTAATAYAAEVSASSDPAYLAASGDVTLNLTIRNTGSSTIDGISITNANGVSFDTAGVSIAAGSQHTFSKRVTVPAELIGKPIEFSVTYSEGGETKSATASVTIQSGTGAGTVIDPGTGTTLPTTSTSQITATRSTSATQASPGDVITLKYVLTNTGVTDVAGISITDKEIGGKNPMVTGVTVPAGQSYTYEHLYTMGKTTVVSAPVISYLGADGVTPVNVTVAEKTLGMVNTKLDFTVEQGAASAEGVTFTLFLTNNGNQKLSKLKIVDEQNETVASDFSLAIGESKSITYKVPSDAARNVVFYITGTDAAGQSYADNTNTFSVREYIDPSLIGVDFSAEVIQTLNAGSIRVVFTVSNTGSLTMSNLVLSEEQLGDLYNKESLAAGTENIEQNVYIGEPRDLVFTLSMNDPAGNPFTYTAHISADYVGVDASDFADQPITEAPGEGDIVAEVGSTISDALRTVLIVLAILTVIACAALIVLSQLEREERRRIAKRRAHRERMMLEQAQQTANLMTSGGTPPAAPHSGAASSRGESARPRTSAPASSARPAPRTGASGDTAGASTVRRTRPDTDLGATSVRRTRPETDTGTSTVRRTRPETDSGATSVRRTRPSGDPSATSVRQPRPDASRTPRTPRAPEPGATQRITRRPED